MNGTFLSGSLRLSSHLARAARSGTGGPAVIMCHGFPTGPIDARHSAVTFPQFVDRVASEMNWTGLTFTFRGCGASDGDFSLQGWVDDLRAAIDFVEEEAAPSGIWIIGASTGGSLAVCVAADDPRVHGLALLAARADFDDWAAQPRRFLEHAREIGAIRRPGFPPAFDEWSRELRRFRPTNAARRFAPRPLLLVHGDDDESVPVADSRVIAEAHGSAELRIITGAGHRLRHDPRAIAVLMGWLERQQP